MFKDVQDGWEKWLLDMAGLSTIADMVPLKNENRIFARFGLKHMAKTSSPGIKTLLKKALLLCIPSVAYSKTTFPTATPLSVVTFIK